MTLKKKSTGSESSSTYQSVIEVDYASIEDRMLAILTVPKKPKTEQEELDEFVDKYIFDRPITKPPFHQLYGGSPYKFGKTAQLVIIDDPIRYEPAKPFTPTKAQARRLKKRRLLKRSKK